MHTGPWHFWVIIIRNDTACEVHGENVDMEYGA